jgi:hypothetical protein
MDSATEFRKLAAWYERCAAFMQLPQDREMRLRYADHFRRMADAEAREAPRETPTPQPA